MMMGFILNGEDVQINLDPEKRLVDVLRNEFNLLGAKSGCRAGFCGSCQIILNGEVVKACLIPAFKIIGCELITIEGFSQTDEYQDISFGFSEAGLISCGFCNTSIILTTETLLSKNKLLTKDEILSAFSGIKCRCTEPEELVRGVLMVADYRKRRLHG